MHQLLNNTSGLPYFVNYWKEVNTKPATTHDILALIKDKPWEFELGAKWKYSSTGFVIPGQVIEEVTGRPYEKVLAQQILKPLKMNATGLESGKPVAGMTLGDNMMEKAEAGQTDKHELVPCTALLPTWRSLTRH